GRAAAEPRCLRSIARDLGAGIARAPKYQNRKGRGYAGVGALRTRSLIALDLDVVGRVATRIRIKLDDRRGLWRYPRPVVTQQVTDNCIALILVGLNT